MRLRGKVLTPDGWEDTLGIDGNVIGAGVREIDLRGCLILPGIVDLHGDGFERHLAPRRGAVGDQRAALFALEAELAACGITTATLAQFFSWEGGMRSPDFAETLANALSVHPAQIDLRLQLRLETHLTDQYARALDLIDRAGIGYVVLNDHLPHAALAKGKRPPRMTGQALKSGRSPEAHLALLKELSARTPDVPAALKQLTNSLRKRGILIGSHDDNTAAQRAEYRSYGATLSEFPETIAAAEAAHHAGETVVMGAPNVVRGGSHQQKVSAQDVVAAGLCTALASDYHYPSMVAAAFALSDRGVIPFAKAWRLISAAPANVLNLSDRGELTAGKRADITIIREETRRVEACLVAGQCVYLTGDTATSLIGSV